MDGIFGVGLAEMLIVGLALFIIGGPENTAKWARQMGRWVRQARQMWADVMAEMERELGPEGKEIMDTARDLSKGARDVRNMNPTRRMVSETSRMIQDAVDIRQADEPAPSSVTKTADDTASNNGQKAYQAWLPPDQKSD